MTSLRALGREALQDLRDDYRRVRAARGRLAAWRWLAAEAGSLAAAVPAIAWARVQRGAAGVRRDSVAAVRGLSRRPVAAAIAVGTLAAGLAAVATALALASALLDRPVSPRYGDAVRRLAATDRTARTATRFSEPELEVVRAAVGDISRLASVYLQPVVVRVGDRDTQSMAEIVSGAYDELIGTETVLGRPLLDIDARAGAAPVAVISQTLWRDRFDRRPAVLGAELRLNGVSFTVVGVARGPGSSTFLGASVDAWVTSAHADALLSRGWRENPADRFWTTLLRHDAAASAEIAERLARARAELALLWPDPWQGRRLLTHPGTVLTGNQRAQAGALSAVLVALAALILAAAAANVAGVRVAGAAADQGRAAILLAMGAGRGSLVRRLLVEGALLGTAAGALALAPYLWARRSLADIGLLPTLALRLDLPFDARMAALIVGGGAVVGVLLSIGPAWWAARLDLARALRDGSVRGTGGAGLARIRRVLVAVQVAVGLTLVVGASLFTQTLRALHELDVGFARAGLVAMDFDVEPAMPDAAMLPQLARDALAAARALPGVTDAAFASRAPIDVSTPATALRHVGTDTVAVGEATFYVVTPTYFQTVGVPIVRGRDFSEAEADREDDVAVVNDVLAATLWPGGDAVGRALVLHPEGRALRVVGVARTSKYRTLAEPPGPHFYRPTSPRFGMALLVRTSGEPRRTLADLHQALRGLGPGVTGFFPRTFDDHLAVDVLPARAAAWSAGVLGAVALLLSTFGLYGVVMWYVEVRRREIGVRVALGASPAAVRRLVVRQALGAALPGLCLGGAMSLGAARLGRTLLVGVAPADPVALVTGIAALLAAVLIASYEPSRRATAVDPIDTLRAE